MCTPPMSVHTYMCIYAYTHPLAYTHIHTYSHAYMHMCQKIDYVELIEQNNQGKNKLDFYFSLQENHMTYS